MNVAAKRFPKSEVRYSDQRRAVKAKVNWRVK